VRDFREFRQHWRSLAGATIGIASAGSLHGYIINTFAPYLLDEFGWTRAQWAMLGLVPMLTIICLPIAGRAGDLYGVRRVAAVGAFSFPLSLVAMTLMNGSLAVYVAIYLFQVVIGSTASITVYSRAVAETFSGRRGLALAVSGSFLPIVAAVGSPLVSSFVTDHGWRAGLLAVAAFSLVGGTATIALLPGRKPHTASVARRAASNGPGGVVGTILRQRIFWIMFAAIFFVNVPFALTISQIKVVAIAEGLNDTDAALLVSAFAIGSMAGRAIVGVALDRFPAHFVAAVVSALPCAGLLLLASNYDSFAAIAVAVLLMALSFGGEGDILPFLVTRYFAMDVFGVALGLITTAFPVAVGLGSVVLSMVLARTGGFTPFMLAASAASIVGCFCFMALGHPNRTNEEPGSHYAS
jgi:predicted MFS family arabinose efflux permease